MTSWRVWIDRSIAFDSSVNMNRKLYCVEARARRGAAFSWSESGFRVRKPRISGDVICEINDECWQRQRSVAPTSMPGTPSASALTRRQVKATSRTRWVEVINTRRGRLTAAPKKTLTSDSRRRLWQQQQQQRSMFINFQPCNGRRFAYHLLDRMRMRVGPAVSLCFCRADSRYETNRSNSTNRRTSVGGFLRCRIPSCSCSVRSLLPQGRP